MKYIFNFKEINYGSVTIESDHMPDDTEVVDAIMNGNAYFGNTDYGDIQLEEPERATPQRERPYER